MQRSKAITSRNDDPPPMNAKAQRCTAIARSTGERCRNMALEGLTICKVHGGLGIRAAAKANIKHGMYSTYLTKVEGRMRIGQLINEFEDSEEPLNLLPELAALRALFVDFIERYDEWRVAFLDWHASFGREDENPKPRRVMDIAEAHKILAEVSRVVERIEKIRSANAVSRPELGRIMQEMGRAVERYVTDTEAQEKIRDAWLAIRL